MDEELFSIWEVIWEMILKEEIENNVQSFYGRKLSPELLDTMNQSVNATIRRIVPEDYVIDTSNSSYTLLNLSIRIDFSSTTLIVVEPVFTENNVYINIKLNI